MISLAARRQQCEAVAPRVLWRFAEPRVTARPCAASRAASGRALRNCAAARRRVAPYAVQALQRAVRGGPCAVAAPPCAVPAPPYEARVLRCAVPQVRPYAAAREPDAALPAHRHGEADGPAVVP